jgi:hypothetical protein
MGDFVAAMVGGGLRRGENRGGKIKERQGRRNPSFEKKSQRNGGQTLHYIIASRFLQISLFVIGAV